MHGTNFFSSNAYIFLPTKNNPKVALCVDNSTLAANSFKLYNPFSLKAKVFKGVLRISFMTLNIFFRLFGIRKEKSDFANYLEELLKQPLVVSIYFATVHDKVVLQLQSIDAEIIGYLKYPLNDIGLKHIKNEIMAFEILSKNGIVEPYILCDKYKNKPFLILGEIDGEIGMVEYDHIINLLKLFKQNRSYRLNNHPRIIGLKHALLKHNMLQQLEKLETFCNHSTKKYALVYEHGDFAPWNIVKVDNQYIPFDFEYFIEEGLEYFDLIKYYYQIGKLLEKKRGNELIKFISKKMNIEEIKLLLYLFLIKEIIRNKEENEPYDFEIKILKLLEIE